MRGFLLGLLVGAVAGAGALYLALERPWGRLDALAQVVPDAGAVKESSGKKGRGKRRRRRRRKGDVRVPLGDQLVELSAADRVPVWRGPKVALPPREMDFAAGGGGRTLSQSEINAGIASGKRAVIRCIADARGNAELSASIKLHFLVESNGRVSKLRVRAPTYLMENGLYPCVKSAVGSMSFPGTGAATLVRVPFDLS